MNPLTNTNLIYHLPNNFHDMGFNNQVKLLGFDLNNPANNEEIMDKLLLHGKYANPSTENFPSNNLSQHKAILAEINNDQKINFFAKLLSKNLITKKYYETQIERYGVLKTLCRYTIFKQLQGDHTEKLNKIEELPLPKSLKQFLKDEDVAIADKQLNSPSR